MNIKFLILPIIIVIICLCIIYCINRLIYKSTINPKSLLPYDDKMFFENFTSVKEPLIISSSSATTSVTGTTTTTIATTTTTTDTTTSTTTTALPLASDNVNRIPQLSDIKVHYTQPLHPQEEIKDEVLKEQTTKYANKYANKYEMDMVDRIVDPSEYYRQVRPVRTYLEEPVLIRGYNYNLFIDNLKAVGESLTGEVDKLPEGYISEK